MLSAVQGRLQWLGHCGEGGTTIGARLGTPAPTAREASSIAEVDDHDVPVRFVRKNRWRRARSGPVRGHEEEGTRHFYEYLLSIYPYHVYGVAGPVTGAATRPRGRSADILIMTVTVSSVMNQRG